MGHKSIGYHTRLDGNNTVKVTGGSFAGSFDTETVERMVKAFFTAKVTPSGRVVFVDKSGREVSLYFTVDAATTEAGKAALAEHRKKKEESQKIEDQKEADIEELMRSMSADEILQRLKG
ncbi:hypothetical protein [Pseudomonas sp. P8_250]|uniref:hypothetical protein n=1 Tax=Pseudomonas sp. P8_250 TaxID=3043446 RepID=UPI002A3690B4|nr:hypothetical protein [Pseudomonas sp. P8_250]MDX9668734.1 hypothetical protein [Pseudomonas sp. P8_250]